MSTILDIFFSIICTIVFFRSLIVLLMGHPFEGLVGIFISIFILGYYKYVKEYKDAQ